MASKCPGSGRRQAHDQQDHGQWGERGHWWSSAGSVDAAAAVVEARDERHDTGVVQIRRPRVEVVDACAAALWRFQQVRLR